MPASGDPSQQTRNQALVHLLVVAPSLGLSPCKRKPHINYSGGRSGVPHMEPFVASIHPGLSKFKALTAEL